MSEPILSPDGNFVWDGSKWVPHTSNQQSMQMQDSVISGDVVSSTTIHRSDADVIKAAMDGVVASIKEMNTIQNTTQQPSTTHQQSHTLPLYKHISRHHHDQCSMEIIYW